MKLNAKQLRITKPSPQQLGDMSRHHIHIVLDNVMDTYNIGSIFRLADAVAAEEIILCGKTETPPSSRIHKAAVGTEAWVKWRYFLTAGQAVEKLKTEQPGITVIAVEQDAKSVPLSQLSVSMPVAVVVGHETAGVSEEVKNMADTIIELPMYGINKSLNVVVSAGIILYKIIS